MKENENRLFVDVHVIQSLPPSCVNRDDTGSPKTAVYGGVRRARVSSQSWKHAMRMMFRDYFDESELAERTKRIIEKVAENIILLEKNKKIEDATVEEKQEAIKSAKNILSKSNIGIENKTRKTKEAEKTEESKEEEQSEKAKALFFMSNKQAENLAKLALMDPLPSKKEVQEALNEGKGVEISLFGRMVADDPALNADASAQIAHAISTHKVENEYDYYTAMDDRTPEDQAGAGMIGTIEFNSSTLYRYATVAVHDLKKNLGDNNATAKAITEFLRAFVCSMPTGKQNTFANSTPPYAVMVALRRDQPVNLVGAFETPIRHGEGGYLKRTAEILEEYTQTVYEKFFDAPEKTFITAIDDALARLGEGVKFTELLEKTEKEICRFLQEEVE